MFQNRSIKFSWTGVTFRIHSEIVSVWLSCSSSREKKKLNSTFFILFLLTCNEVIRDQEDYFSLVFSIRQNLFDCFMDASASVVFVRVKPLMEIKIEVFETRLLISIQLSYAFCFELARNRDALEKRRIFKKIIKITNTWYKIQLLLILCLYDFN